MLFWWRKKIILIFIVGQVVQIIASLSVLSFQFQVTGRKVIHLTRPVIWRIPTRTVSIDAGSYQIIQYSDKRLTDINPGIAYVSLCFGSLRDCG